MMAVKESLMEKTELMMESASVSSTPIFSEISRMLPYSSEPIFPLDLHSWAML